jgi:hypothetical protein
MALKATVEALKQLLMVELLMSEWTSPLDLQVLTRCLYQTSHTPRVTSAASCSRQEPSGLRPESPPMLRCQAARSFATWPRFPADTLYDERGSGL